MRKIFLGPYPVVVIGVHRGHRPAAAERHTGRAEGLHARCPALLPPGDGSGRLHHPRLPSATSSQIGQGLRSGVEKPRAIAPRIQRSAPRASVIDLIWPGRRLRAVADGIGFRSVFPYMGPAAYRHARNPGRADSLRPDQCSQLLMTQRERTSIRQNTPRREFSGRVLDHSSASPDADPGVLQFRQNRRRYRRSCDAR